MSKIAEKSKSPAQKAVEAKPLSDGPHHSTKRKKSKTQDSSESATSPAFVVAVSKQEKTQDEQPTGTKQLKHDPEEQRAKARSLLKSTVISPEDRKVLEQILGPDKET
ncbi:MAG: hypothetical protein SGI74_08640 [Oligoflexia bacterium]|nr:hypothetical protein [Oligoflexia bacterium]